MLFPTSLSIVTHKAVVRQKSTKIVNVLVLMFSRKQDFMMQLKIEIGQSAWYKPVS